MPAMYARVKNVGSTPWDDKQPGHPYTIPAGAEVIVPWWTMCIWLGDPELRDSPKEPVRSEEKTRLSLRYGVGTGMDGDVRNPDWAACMPELEAYTLDGERLATVADDPTGTLAPAAAPLLSPNETASKIAELESMIRSLQGSTPTTAAVAQSEAAQPSAGSTASTASTAAVEPVPEPETSGQPPADSPQPRSGKR